MLPNKYIKIFFSFLLVLVFVASLGVTSQFFAPERSSAQPSFETNPAVVAGAVVSTQSNIWSKIWKILNDVWDKAGAVLYKNTLTYFLTQLAQQTAEWLASGNSGKTALFEQRPIERIALDAAGGALGDFVDTLVKDGIGFEGFDICNPNLKTQFDISYTLFNQFSPGKQAKKPKCTWREINKNWTTYMEQVRDDPKKYLYNLSFSFNPQENDFGAYLKAESALLSKQQEAKYNATIKRLTEVSGLKPITSAVTGTILAPEKTVENLITGGTKDSNAPILNYTGEAVADAVGVFTNTLASKLMERWLKKGLKGELPPQTGPTFAYNQNSDAAAVARARSSSANEPFTVSQVDLSKDGSGLRLADSLSLPKIPCQGCTDKKAGPTYEVLSQDFMTAVEQKLTLTEAIKNGVLNGSKIFGYTKEQDKVVEPDWRSGLPYRSIVIGRTMRIFPYSWEIAANFIKNYGGTLQFSNNTLTLQEVMDCYQEKDDPFGKTIYGTIKKDDPRFPEKCRADFNGNGRYDDINPLVDYNPFYHLVDPNWVLKIPESSCYKLGTGSEKVNVLYMCLHDNKKNDPQSTPPASTVLFSKGEGAPMCDYNSKTNSPEDLKVALVTRDENYCADWQSCVVENADGSCQTKGYCLAEKPITKLSGTSCDYPSRGMGVYDSCETFTDGQGKTASYLRSTLQSCDTNDAGCSLYGLSQVPDSTGSNVWSLDKQVYLNGQAADCDNSNAGCTKVMPYNSGVNLAFNGSFTDKETNGTIATPTPTSWKLEQRNAKCEVEADNNFAFTLIRGPASGQTACVVDSAGFIPVEQGYTYALKGSFGAVAKIAGTTIPSPTISLDLLAYDGDKQRIHVGDKWNFSAGGFVGYPVDAQEIRIENIAVNGDINNGGKGLPLNTKYVQIEFAIWSMDGAVDTGKAKLSASDVQLVITKSPVISQDGKFDNLSYYHSDYSNSKDAYHVKLAPDYLHCQDYYKIDYNYENPSTCNTAGKVWNGNIGYCVEGGSAECSSFAAFCSSSDLGCQGYTPASGGPEVSARLATSDQCPASCLNYDSYYQEPNNFEIRDYPIVYTDASTCQANNGTWNNGKCFAIGAYTAFIPSTATDCSVEDAGCQEFTNLDAVKQGGEGKEYFTYLRQCVAAENPEINTYYTWEGSDTTGYQLKKWLRLQSNVKDRGIVGPCTNFDPITNKCLDTGTGWTNPITAPGNRGLCSSESITTNPDCRDFFDINDKHFYILQSRTISAPAKGAPQVCHPYRSTKTGQIYNADPADAVTCRASAVGCQVYRGNDGNNVKNIFQSTFEQGTTGGWTNTATEIQGLNISNEALQQNGHSLKVYVNNDKIIAKVPAGSLQIGKYYNLSLVAKKGQSATQNKHRPVEALLNSWNWFKQLALVWSPDSAQAQAPGLDFELPNLVLEWQRYSLGPVQYNGGSTGDIIMSLKANGLNAHEPFFVDNIVLQAFDNNFYKIEKTWKTPVECDNQLDNPNGCEPVSSTNCGRRLAIGAQLGCSAYTDRNSTAVNLKSFERLCSATSIGCSAFINTQNTSNEQGEKVFAAECNSKVGKIDANKCYIKGQFKCDVTLPATSCVYKNAVIPNDELFFSVDKPETRCNGTFQGCQEMGRATLDRAVDSFASAGFVKSFSGVFKLNNPDNYSATLCSSSNLYCEYLTGQSSGKHSFFNPIDQGASSGRVCTYDGNKKAWLEEGTDKLCNNRSSQYLMTADSSLYQGWAGKCEDKYSGCEAFYNPEKPLAANNGAAACDAGIGLSYQGICNINNPGETKVQEDGVYVPATGATTTKYYCQKEVNGVKHKVCELSSSTDTECSYGSSDWICVTTEKKDGNGLKILTPCQVGDTTASSTVCTIEPINDGAVHKRICKYSSVCEANFFYQDKVKSCDGTLDREAGCLAFNQPSQGSANFSSLLTSSGESPKSCKSGDNFTSNSYCNANRLLKAEKDRSCSEWLYCASSIKYGDKEVCLDMARCSQADSSGNCILPKYSSDRNKEVVYQALNPSQRDQAAWLTGYSRVGYSWDSNHSLAGYFAPEAMSQIGEKVDSIKNGDFENYGDYIEVTSGAKGVITVKNDGVATIEKTGWEYSKESSCSYGLDPANPYSGYYSLKITDTNQGFCTVKAGKRNVPTIYNPKKDYALSFAARSQGEQGAAVGFLYYSSKHKDRNGDPAGCVFGALKGSDRSATEEGGPLHTIAPYEGIAYGGQSNIPAGNIKSVFTGDYTIFYNTDCTNGQERNLAQISDWVWGYTLDWLKFPKDWQKYVVSIGPDGKHTQVPETADLIQPVFFAPHSNLGATGSIWLDEVEVGPVLKQSNSVFSAKDCRLFPKDDQGGSPACNYSMDNKSLVGWNGFCTQYDPQNPSQCLQWLPVDAIVGDKMSLYGDTEATVYNNRKPLYYCVQSRGLINYEKDAVTYGSGFGYCHETCGPEVAGNLTFNDNQTYRISDLAGIDIDFDNLVGCSGGSGDWIYGRYEMKRNFKNEFVFIGKSSGHIPDSLGMYDDPEDAHYLNYEYFRDHVMGDFDDKNWIAAVVKPDTNGYIKELRYKLCDGSANNGGVRFGVRFKPYEMCSVVARVVDTGGQEMAVASNLRQWNTGNAYKINYDFPQAPFGSVNIPVGANPDPGQWPSLVSLNQGSDILDHQYYSASVPLSVETDNGAAGHDKRICTSFWNKECSTREEDCKASSTSQPVGECSGIGKFIYKEGYNTGVPCKETIPPNFECRAIGDMYKTGGVNDALKILNNLYAKVHDVYQATFDNVSSSWKYINITSSVPTDIKDFYKTSGNYQIPKVENISIDNQTTGNITKNAPGGSVKLKFTTNIATDQQPIDYLYVDWQDGSQKFVATGPLTPRSDRNQPFILSHVYSCETNSAGTKCEACFGSGQFDSADGTCRYKWPKVQVMDHWKWCNCPDASTCVNNELTCQDTAFTPETDSRIIIKSNN